MSTTTTGVTADAIFEAVRQKYGFVPNVIREMARSVPVARVYVEGQAAMAEASLDAREQQAVQLAISTINGCEYCQAAHRKVGQMVGISPSDLDTIQARLLPAEPRLGAVVKATWALMNTRGRLTAEDLGRLEAQGIGRAQVYEIVAFIGLKTISNWVNHIAHTEIDAQLRG